MKYDFFPIDKIRLRTSRLELRIPTNTELAELGRCAYEGIHPVGEMPFYRPWTRQTPTERARSVMQHHWKSLADWKPTQWMLQFGVFYEGKPIGVQDVMATNFAVLREVTSGSWLGRQWQGRGLGTEMRAAMLYFAFEGLGAKYANSGAFTDNPASTAVSLKLGYEDNGVKPLAVEGKARENRLLRLSRENWDKECFAVEMTGVEDARPMFGL